MLISWINIFIFLIFYVFYMFRTRGFIFRETVYIQLWYGTFYMRGPGSSIGIVAD